MFFEYPPGLFCFTLAIVSTDICLKEEMLEFKYYFMAKIYIFNNFYTTFGILAAIFNHRKKIRVAQKLILKQKSM